MIALTFDLEVENRRYLKRLAGPFDPRNYVVEAGWSVNGGKPESKRFEENHRDPVLPVEILKQMGKGDVFIGFNIKFDAIWVWAEPEFQAALKRGATVYCGQYVEYLLGGMVQEVQMASMNDTVIQYGGGQKIDAVKEMWEAGALTSEIPADMLHDYLVGDGKEIIGDVHNTWLIYVGQVNRMKKEHPARFRTMVKHRMDGLLFSTEAEFNGLHVNTVIGANQRAGLVADIEVAREHLDKFIPELPPELEFSWGSSQKKSCLIFGGTVSYEKWVAHTPLKYVQKEESWPLFQGDAVPPGECLLAGAVYVREVANAEEPNTVARGTKFYQIQDTFKSGLKAGQGKYKLTKVDDLEKPKGAKQPHYYTFKGYTTAKPHWKGEKTDAYDGPLYSTAGDIIDELTQRGLPFTDALGTHTSLSKDLGTYYWAVGKKGVNTGMLTLVGPDGIIHHTLNHTSTVTSRMSSKDPNLQNIPRAGTSNVKKMFTSRFGEIGRMAEIDYSQLEVVIQGVLTRDVQLMQDLNDKVDFHCKRLSVKIGRPYQEIWDLHHIHEDADIGRQRTGAKNFSFQRAYGAGVAAIMLATGMSKEDVEALIAAEELLYPGLTAFDQMLEKAIMSNRRTTDRRLYLDGVAFPQAESYWDSPTGTRYKWREGITPEFMHKHGKFTGFSPTERKNYCVQGFGGEIMQTMLGKLFRYFIENDRFGGDVLLVNTVHDCVLLDGKADKIEEVTREVQRILETVPQVFNEAFPDLNIEVPFPAAAEIGHDLFKMHGLH